MELTMIRGGGQMRLREGYTKRNFRLEVGGRNRS